ncbi:MAG: hypothetical protein HC882_07695 [Acidobacteria bacterium]|nr:hypothetical protein [Acidobacteriota bacterium]
MATLPDWEHEPFRLRLQLRAESEGEAPRLLGGMLLGTAARAPVAEGETPEPPPNCALNSTRLRDLAMRQ